jgi:hypothetical protein
MPTAATVELGSVAFLAWCSLFSCCSGYSATSAALAESRLISRPNSSLGRHRRLSHAEDLWASPIETYAGEMQKMGPYYILAQLPGST